MNNMKKTVKVFGVIYAGEIFPTTMLDNNKVFTPLALFKTRSKAVAWRKEKFMGNTEARHDVAPIAECTITYEITSK